jgi:hypothetical protein
MQDTPRILQSRMRTLIPTSATPRVATPTGVDTSRSAKSAASSSHPLTPTDTREHPLTYQNYTTLSIAILIAISRWQSAVIFPAPCNSSTSSSTILGSSWLLATAALVLVPFWNLPGFFCDLPAATTCTRTSATVARSQEDPKMVLELVLLLPAPEPALLLLLAY